MQYTKNYDTPPLKPQKTRVSHANINTYIQLAKLK